MPTHSYTYFSMDLNAFNTFSTSISFVALNYIQGGFPSNAHILDDHFCISIAMINKHHNQNLFNAQTITSPPQLTGTLYFMTFKVYT